MKEIHNLNKGTRYLSYPFLFRVPPLSECTNRAKYSLAFLTLKDASFCAFTCFREQTNTQCGNFNQQHTTKNNVDIANHKKKPGILKGIQKFSRMQPLRIELATKSKFSATFPSTLETSLSQKEFNNSSIQKK